MLYKLLSHNAKRLFGLSILIVLAFSAVFSNAPSAQAEGTEMQSIFLPLVVKNWPPIPATPNLWPIDNSDQDDTYSVSWSWGDPADTYLLQEATQSDFSNGVSVYQGILNTWMPPAGKTPGTYYYRVKGINPYNQGAWSNAQSVTIYPLYLGLKVRWDGVGYIRGSNSYNVGTHDTVQFDAVTDIDTIRANWYDWYDPDPYDFGVDSWYSYYSITTGEWKSASAPGNPSWKWSDSWKLGYNAQYTNGQTVLIDGQKFTVTGPHDGYTTYGKSIRYWEFTNQTKFLYYDSGGDWTQYVHPGDIVLRYDAGNSRLQIFSSTFRRYYYQGRLTTDSVQYIITLSSATSIPGSPPFVMAVMENQAISNPTDELPPIEGQFSEGKGAQPK